MMKMRCPIIRSATLAFLAMGLFDIAEAEEIFRPISRSETVVSCGLSRVGVGCMRFQGYIYVRRGAGESSTQADSATPWTDGKAASEPSLSAKRLYLPIGDGELR